MGLPAVFKLVLRIVNVQMGMLYRMIWVLAYVVFRRLHPDAYEQHPRMTFR